MKAIVTRYKGPTNYKGSRIIADDGDGNRITISYPYELSGEAVHRKAADALCEKMNWHGSLIGGATKTGYAFVFAPRWVAGDPCPTCHADYAAYGLEPAARPA